MQLSLKNNNFKQRGLIMEKEIIEKARQKIDRAKSHILTDHCFYSSKAMSLDHIPARQYGTVKIETAATNGKVIVYNPDYINTLDNDRIIFLLCHEYWHVNLLHHVRRGNRDPGLWNEAGDYTINDILLHDKVGQMIDGALYNPEFEGNSTEKNYNILYQDRKNNDPETGQDQENDQNDKSDQSQDPGTGTVGQDQDQENDQSGDQSGTGQDNSQDPGQDQENGPNNNGSSNDPGQGQNGQNSSDGGQDQDKIDQVIDDPCGGVFDLTEKDLEPGQTLEDVAEDIKTDLMNDISFAEKAGSGISEYAKDLLNKKIFAPKTNWKQKLQAWLTENLKNDFSFIKPSYRSNNGFRMPGLYSEELGKVIIAIDVSGSITYRPGAIDKFQTELNELRSAYQFDTTVIYFAGVILNIEEFQRHEKIEIVIPGTGGTRIKPVFNWIADNNQESQISGLIVFTDLEIMDYPASNPIYPVIWVKYGNCKRYLPNFGDIAEIDNE